MHDRSKQSLTSFKLRHWTVCCSALSGAIHQCVCWCSPRATDPAIIVQVRFRRPRASDSPPCTPRRSRETGRATECIDHPTRCRAAPVANPIKRHSQSGLGLLRSFRAVRLAICVGVGVVVRLATPVDRDAEHQLDDRLVHLRHEQRVVEGDHITLARDAGGRALGVGRRRIGGERHEADGGVADVLEVQVAHDHVAEDEARRVGRAARLGLLNHVDAAHEQRVELALRDELRRRVDRRLQKRPDGLDVRAEGVAQCPRPRRKRAQQHTRTEARVDAAAAVGVAHIIQVAHLGRRDESGDAGRNHELRLLHELVALALDDRRPHVERGDERVELLAGARATAQALQAAVLREGLDQQLVRQQAKRARG
mmetsp:Transcript_59753/g.163784  ORF Transcript_59753/g.163784 Transcript_59753/m.163784 type:complete len:368 (-) Transcript_59753:72-1175(-)